jgi:hypothetical protein
MGPDEFGTVLKFVLFVPGSHGTGRITRREVFTRNWSWKMVLKKSDSAVRMAPSNLEAIPAQNVT